jgi:4-deoxy-L-threo-5-hexosulose-uronate ketol-isomerase
MQTVFLADPARYPRMSTQELRDAFLPAALFSPGEIRLAYIDLDRAVVGMAAPLRTALPLPADPLLRAAYFLERRELGALNIGGRGAILVEGQRYDLDHLDCLYLGRGHAQVALESADETHPALFYLLSYPAHTSHPVTLIRKPDAVPTELGTEANANRRVVTKYIHLEGARSCQLVMGVTHLHPGNVWNTMPPHTHLRRSEIYMYFNLPEEERVFHFMGPPEETRHLVLANRDIVVSPGWSIHAGTATHAYSFCWGMGGENQEYADMDPVPLVRLR